MAQFKDVYMGAQEGAARVADGASIVYNGARATVGTGDDAPQSVPPVHLELQALFMALMQLDEVSKELFKRLNSVSAPAVAKDEPQLAVPANYGSVARQIADARMAVQDKTTAITQMIDLLQV